MALAARLTVIKGSGNNASEVWNSELARLHASVRESVERRWPQGLRDTLEPTRLPLVAAPNSWELPRGYEQFLRGFISLRFRDTTCPLHEPSLVGGNFVGMWRKRTTPTSVKKFLWTLRVTLTPSPALQVRNISEMFQNHENCYWEQVLPSSNKCFLAGTTWMQVVTSVL